MIKIKGDQITGSSRQMKNKKARIECSITLKIVYNIASLITRQSVEGDDEVITSKPADFFPKC